MYEHPLPLTGLTIVNNPSSIKLQTECRRARLNDVVTPAAENAWVYVKVPRERPAGTSVLPNYLGPVLNVRRGQPCRVTWINKLTGMPKMPGMDACLDAPPIHVPAMKMDGMQASVGVVAHLHGGKVKHDADGWPLEPVGYRGNPYGFPTSRVYTYPNDQRAAMLWFHDHGMDSTAPQVHAGLAGLYFVRDSSDDDLFALIGGAGQEIPLVIQDRVMAPGGCAVDYQAGIPTADGYARPEFLGDTIFVNGRPTPFHPVTRAVYRLRILNGSNARTYALALMDPFWGANDPGNTRIWHSDRMRVIGTEAGLMTKSVQLGETDYLLLAPGERVDVLLDLTAPTVGSVDCLRLVNLALKSATSNEGTPEGIFQTDAKSVLAPSGNADRLLLDALRVGPANIMQFCLSGSAATAPPTETQVDSILARHANEDGFRVHTGSLTTDPVGAPIARNRFVLLMNHVPEATTTNPLTNWKDTQMWELGPVPGAPTGRDGRPAVWNLPFAVDVATAVNPAAGSPAGQTTYGVYRATFFAEEPPTSIAETGVFPELHAPTFTPKSGTYERWYVANVGSDQPLTDAVVDMHPFHMHLVNFTVLRRWSIDGTGHYQELESAPSSPTAPAARRLDFDSIARHDTVRIQSGELLELLVYFPEDYTGRYVYHCHLVEHEDMGMMLDVDVR